MITRLSRCGAQLHEGATNSPLGSSVPKDFHRSCQVRSPPQIPARCLSPPCCATLCTVPAVATRRSVAYVSLWSEYFSTAPNQKSYGDFPGCFRKRTLEPLIYISVEFMYLVIGEWWICRHSNRMFGPKNKVRHEGHPLEKSMRGHSIRECPGRHVTRCRVGSRRVSDLLLPGSMST